MSTLSPDPLAGSDLADYGRRLRQGETSIAATVEGYLDRIARLDPRLGAYQHVAAASARATAAALDGLLRAGTDLGPLMGVPVAVKDLLAVEGMPTTAGTKIDVADLVGTEGRFVRMLRRAGCVILGKTKTVEFAYGAVGTNAALGTPWNPTDAETQRIPGGSSSGSAVAVAAGLAAFAIGSDTGGSVRLPAAFNGIFGLKTTAGLWPLDGIFPLSPSLDTVGLLTRDAADAALIFAVLTGRPVATPRDMVGLRLARVLEMSEGVEPAVADCLAAALARLDEAGALIGEVALPEAAERLDIYGATLPAELVASLGRARFEAGRSVMDPVVAARTARGFAVPAEAYIRAQRRLAELVRLGERRMVGTDAWVAPAAPILPAAVGDLAQPETALKLATTITSTAHPVNMLGQCAVSLPIHQLGAPLPVGLQIIGPPMAEDRVLGIALAAEALLGRPPAPDLAPFLAP